MEAIKFEITEESVDIGAIVLNIIKSELVDKKKVEYKFKIVNLKCDDVLLGDFEIKICQKN